MYITRLASDEIFSAVLISPLPDQEGNNLQRQKILMFVYHIYNHNWRNISTIYVYNKTSIKEIFSPSNKIHWEVGRAKDLSAPRYLPRFELSILDCSCTVNESGTLKNKEKEKQEAGGTP